MDLTTVLGYIAGTISTLTFLPQVVKTWRTKSANDVSFFMFIFATISVILWFIYGILIQDGAIIYTNSFIFVLSIIMLYLIFKYRSK